MLANRAFTLLESLIALSLAALVMVTIQFLIPHLNQVTQPDDRTTFQTALHQLEIQKYSVKDNNNHVINLMSAKGSGQIILMENVDDLLITASGSLFKLTIKIHHRTIHGILYLQKVATS